MKKPILLTAALLFFPLLSFAGGEGEEEDFVKENKSEGDGDEPKGKSKGEERTFGSPKTPEETNKVLQSKDLGSGPLKNIFGNRKGFDPERNAAMSGSDAVGLKSAPTFDDDQAEKVATIGELKTGDFCDEAEQTDRVEDRRTELANCYGLALEDDVEKTGDVTLQWKVGLDGTVKSASIAASTLRHAEAETCMKEEATSWSFQKPDGGICIVNAPLSFRLPDSVSLDVEKEPPPPRPREVSFDETRLDATDVCDTDNVVRVLNARANAVTYCYERGLQAKPELAGDVSASWTLTEQGHVGEVEMTDESLGSEKVTGCVSRVIKRMRFEAPEDGGTCELGYTLEFRPKE